MNNLALKYNNGEKTLGEFQLAQPRLTRHGRGGSILRFTKTGAEPALPADFDYLKPASLVDVSTGNILFQGVAMPMSGRAFPEDRGVDYTFADAWWQMEHLTYRMQWNVNGRQVLSSRVFLFQEIGQSQTPWKYWTAAEQIIDIINFARNLGGIAIQPGRIDPQILPPIYACRSISCAEAIEITLQTQPDAGVAIDYNTQPPTLHVVSRQNCTPISYPYSDGLKHVSTNIKPRSDLQVPAVVFEFQSTNNINGAQSVNFFTDAYPPNATGLELNSQVIAIDLRGASQSNDSGQLRAKAIDPASTAFWQDVKEDLKGNGTIIPSTGIVANKGINDGTPNCITIIDGAGNPVSLAQFPNKYIDGAVASWMNLPSGAPVAVTDVTITAYLSYQVISGLGSIKPVFQPTSVRVKLTNSPDGVAKYSPLASYSQPEIPPPNLAYLEWCSFNNVKIIDLTQGNAPQNPPPLGLPENVQWEGQHQIVEDSISIFPDARNTFNLTGGNIAWATMKAQIDTIEFDFFHGVSSITFGPFKHLTAKQFFDLVMWFRRRIAWENPNVRSTGQDSNGGTQLGLETPKENTEHQSSSIHEAWAVAGLPIANDQNNEAVPGSQAVVQMDGTGGTQGFTGVGLSQRVVTADADITTKYVQLAIDDLKGDPTVKLPAKFMLTNVCIGGNTETCYVLRTPSSGTGQ